MNSLKFLPCQQLKIPFSSGIQFIDILIKYLSIHKGEFPLMDCDYKIQKVNSICELKHFTNIRIAVT